jgi:sporulation protein YlmC with PRC-barrel domain
MLRSLKALFGYRILATDGEIGHVHDFYFDDEHWKVRYLVVDTGGWLNGRLVLLSPVALSDADWERRSLTVLLTREKVENSPEVGTDPPVSRQQEKRLYEHYGWAPYWGLGGVYAADMLGVYPELLLRPAAQGSASPPPATIDQTNGNPHLRSTRQVTGYHIQAEDGQIGRVDDLVADDDGWTIRYMVVDTHNWLPGRRVLISPQWVEEVSWEQSRVYLNLTREKVRRSPGFDPSAPVSREYEEVLFDYYGRPKYWKRVLRTKAATKGPGKA